MSHTFQAMSQKAAAVRDHYNSLQQANGQKRWNAQDRMAGFVGDVGDLSKLIMAKHNLRTIDGDIDEKLAHELSDCLWSIMVLADELDIDLEKAFTITMEQLHQRIELEKKV